jgi:hypothetical protein
VGGAGDGKQLGQALDDGQEDDLENGHASSVFGEFGFEEEIGPAGRVARKQIPVRE